MEIRALITCSQAHSSLLLPKNSPGCFYPTVWFQRRIRRGILCLRFTDTKGGVHTSLVMAKTRVAPLKRLSIPRLELCSAQLLARLLQHAKTIFEVQVFAWTDSTIVLSWLSGNLKRFKTYIGNRVSSIIGSIPPSRWRHVSGVKNPVN